MAKFQRIPLNEVKNRLYSNDENLVQFYYSRARSPLSYMHLQMAIEGYVHPYPCVETKELIDTFISMRFNEDRFFKKFTSPREIFLVDFFEIIDADEELAEFHAALLYELLEKRKQLGKRTFVCSQKKPHSTELLHVFGDNLFWVTGC